MNLEIHRRDEAPDTEVRMTKVFKRWLTSDQYEEIPLDEAEVLSKVLIDTLPAETLTELTRRLNEFASKSKS